MDLEKSKEKEVEPIIEIPSMETHFPREKCDENSFRTDVFIKPPEYGKTVHKVRLIWCCPKNKYNEETKRCENAIQLHKLIREEAKPEEIRRELGESSDIEMLNSKLDALSKKLDRISFGVGTKQRTRKKYSCDELIAKGACGVEPSEKKTYVLCIARKDLNEGKVSSMGEGMKKAWQEIKTCER